MAGPKVSIIKRFHCISCGMLIHSRWVTLQHESREPCCSLTVGKDPVGTDILAELKAVEVPVQETDGKGRKDGLEAGEEGGGQ